MSSLVDAAFDENHVSTENSPFYHKYNISIFSKLLPSLFPNIEGRLEHLLRIGPVVTKWLTAPDGFFYRIGDTEGAGVKLTKEDASNEGFPDDSNTVFKDFASSGYQIIRSHPSTSQDYSFSLILRGGGISYVHSHCDALSFIFYHKGEEIFADPGKFTYEDDDQRAWFISDAAHCTAGLKEKKFFPKDVDLGGAQLAPIRNIGNSFFLSGQVIKGNIFYHHRRVTFIPNKKIVISDYIFNNTEKNTELRFLLGQGFHYYGDKTGKLKNSNGRSYDVLFSGNIEKIESYQPEDSRAWISKTYGNKKSSGIILAQCLAGEVCIKMEVSLT